MEHIERIFAYDADGVLPGVTLRGHPNKIYLIYRTMVRRGRIPGLPKGWDEVDDREVQLLDFPKPEVLIEDKRMENFYHCLDDFMPTEGVCLPRIGISLREGEMGIDWSGGPLWTSQKIAGFIAWLASVDVDVTLDDGVSPECSAGFAVVLARHRMP